MKTRIKKYIPKFLKIPLQKIKFLFLSSFALIQWYQLSKKDLIKLELGSGSKKGDNGFTTVDINGANISWDLTNGIPLKDNSVDLIYSSHLLEHIAFKELILFLKECKRILTTKGILATQSESPESFKKTHISILKTLKKIFRVSETMYSFVPTYPSGIWSWTFSAKEELHLKKPNCKDTLRIEKSCDIWNLNFQNAAFKMKPNKIIKELN